MDEVRNRAGRTWFEVLGPGILVAATGVGAGDLAGGALAGSRLKLTVLWVVVAGAIVKYVLCEGLARWQLTTRQSVTEGAFQAGGPALRYGFLVYLIVWSYSIGGMLMSACGECAQALLPIGTSATGRLVHGIAFSLLAILLVRLGGFRLFERMMTACIGVMFVTVVCVAGLSQPNWGDVLSGLTIPRIPSLDGRGLIWATTLFAGVGGTVTMLCYGNWIREKDRTDLSSLRECRIDLAAGYLMTAVFGVCMVILGSQLPVDQSKGGANLITSLADNMSSALPTAGPVASWLFRIGAFGAVFSSLLGVLQSIPQLINEVAFPSATVTPETRTRRYNGVLWLLGTLPAFNLLWSLPMIQMIAGITGTCFVILFIVTLLTLGWRRRSGFRNGWMSTTILLICLAAFVGYGYLKYFADSGPVSGRHLRNQSDASAVPAQHKAQN